VFKRDEALLSFPPPLIREGGKWVPREIEDFSGCLKGVRLVHNSKNGIEEGKVDCVFCQIVDGKIPGDIVYQDEEVLAFRDINPRAPVHLLIIPKKHFASLNQLTEKEMLLMGRMIGVARQLAEREGVSESGYRLVVNCGEEGGQLVLHLHLHLLGGRQLRGQLS
jgi:histidine triad (HIT) family protein